MNWEDFIKDSHNEPWALDMKECQQDPQWHGEGDVWIHTQMVLDELFKLTDFQNESNENQEVLALTGLLHDIGKPKSTSFRDGKISSPNHSIIGSKFARRLLAQKGLPFKTREKVCNMIKLHMKPPYLIEKENPENIAILTSWNVNNRLLGIFSKADVKGRVSDDIEDSTTKVEIFLEEAKKWNCLETPYEFKNNEARILFFDQRLSSLLYSPYEDYRCTATMMCGLPGSGKDTWIKKNIPHLPMTGFDVMRKELRIKPTEKHGLIYVKVLERTKDLLRNKKDFVLNATCVTRHLRKKWLQLFKNYKAKIKIVYVEPPLETIYKQNKERDNSVPTIIIDDMLKKLEVPNLTECHEIEYIT